MDTLNYKGYIGEYDRYNDGAGASSYFAGNIPSVEPKAKVLFEGETMEELIEDFHAAVEDCIANGYPAKEKAYHISVPESLYTLLISKARKEGMSVSRYVSNALASVVL